MTAREDFTDEEWFRVRAAPWQVVTGVIDARPSGTLATGRELRAAEAQIRRVHDEGSDHDVIGLVARAIVEDDDDTGTPPADDPDADAVEPPQILAAMGPLRTLVDEKLSPAESEAFRTWLVDLATATAEAAREGVVGITGRQVSVEEADFLLGLRSRLGLD